MAQEVKHFRLAFQILATALVLFERFYFGPVGVGAGMADAIVLFTVWSNQWGR